MIFSQMDLAYDLNRIHCLSQAFRALRSDRLRKTDGDDRVASHNSLIFLYVVEDSEFSIP